MYTTTPTRSFRLALAVLATCALQSSAAAEVDPLTRATELANQGITALQDGKWDEAARLLGEALPMAIEANEPPLVAGIQRGLGKANDYLHNGDAALRYYRAYLAHDLAEPLKRKEVEERIAAIEAASRSRLIVETSVAGARVIVDGGAPNPVDEEIVVVPGRHWIQIFASGHDTIEDDVFLIGGETLRYDAQLVRTAPLRTVLAQPAVHEPAARTSKTPAWVTLFLGLGAGGSGAYMMTRDDPHAAAPFLVAGGVVFLLVSTIMFASD